MQAESLPSEPPRKPPVFSLGKFHGQRSLASYSPWGGKKLGMTDGLIHTHRNLFKKTGQIKGTFHARMDIIKKEMVLTEPNKSRRDSGEVARIPRRTIQKRS